MKNSLTRFTVVDMENTTNTINPATADDSLLLGPNPAAFKADAIRKALVDAGVEAPSRLKKAELLDLVETYRAEHGEPFALRGLPTATMAEIKAGTATPVMTVVIAEPKPKEPTGPTARERTKIVAAALIAAGAHLAETWNADETGVAGAEAAEQIAKWLGYTPHAAEVWPTDDDFSGALPMPERLAKAVLLQK